LAQVARSHGMLGVALVLSATGATRLRLTVTDEVPADEADVESANGMAACLPLIAALEGSGGEVPHLPLGPESSLQIGVRHR
jgi:hypothetical protein